MNSKVCENEKHHGLRVKIKLTLPLWKQKTVTATCLQMEIQ